jgi:carbonic anhydrase/acetyltransferase-like protein (isoleucine patch superfamily)
MKRIILQDKTLIPPFGEPARDLRILNKPLWLRQRDILARYCRGALEIDSLDEIPAEFDDETLIHKDNLFFDQHLIDEFVLQARQKGYACQIAFTKNDRAITTHALPLQESIRLSGDLYIADLYYYPVGPHHEPHPLVIDTDAYEMGYYSVPRYMVHEGDLVFQIPARAFLSIENWVHLFLANVPMGVFADASNAEKEMDKCRLKHIRHWKKENWRLFGKKLQLVANTLWERINPFEESWRNHFLSSKSLVKVGKNCSIDPTAIIHGPTVIGDNVYIGPGTVITNSLIGSNVNIMQGSQVMSSVVSDRSFMAFNSALFMSSMMEDCMIAQNTCVQLGVVGRNSFIGANNVFTDFDLDNQPIETYHRGKLTYVGLPVLGSAVGHNCKLGSGFVISPGRMIGPNVTIVYSDQNGLIHRNVKGHDPDDIDLETGEPRRLFFHWPNLRGLDKDKRAVIKKSPQPDKQQHEQQHEQQSVADDTDDEENKEDRPIEDQPVDQANQPEQPRG